MLKRVLLGLVVIAAIAASGWAAWRWQVQTVAIVIVNESARDAEFTWQSWPLADEVVSTVGSCAARSVRLPAGATWGLHADGLDVRSAAFDIPLQEQEMALEIWLEPDGSSRLLPPYPVSGPVSAPIPQGCESGND
jgi:hypothetical protein